MSFITSLCLALSLCVQLVCSATMPTGMKLQLKALVEQNSTNRDDYDQVLASGDLRVHAFYGIDLHDSDLAQVMYLAVESDNAVAVDVLTDWVHFIKGEYLNEFIARAIGHHRVMPAQIILTKGWQNDNEASACFSGDYRIWHKMDWSYAELDSIKD